MEHCPNCKEPGLAESLAAIRDELLEIRSSLREMQKAPQQPEPQKSPNPLKQRATALVIEIDWLFKKDENGAYDRRMSIEAAYRFLAKLKQLESAQAYLDEFLKWVWTLGRPWSGIVRVSPGMFDVLRECFEQRRPTPTVEVSSGEKPIVF